MRWTNSILNILLSLHYTTDKYVISQILASPSGPHFNKNSEDSRSRYYSSSNLYQNASSFSDISLTSKIINCVNDNLTLCNQSNYWNKYYKIPDEVNPIKYSQQFLSTPTKRYGQSYDWTNSGHGFQDQNSNGILKHEPVYYYVDPLRSKVDKVYGSETGSKGHSSQGANHGKDNHESTPGWGWSHQEHHHHHDDKKKHKKKKKGALGKLLEKFKLHKEPEKLIWKEVPECDGFENFIKDLEILSWIFGWIGFAKATIGLILHFLNQVYLTFSVFKVGLPERILTFIELQNPGTAPETLKMITEIIGLIDYLITLLFSYPLGNKIVLIETIAEILTIASLALATITIFDDIVEEKVWTIFGIDLRELFEGYGCHNPFSKDKKIEQFFEKY